jgi:hypothetical protein
MDVALGGVTGARSRRSKRDQGGAEGLTMKKRGTLHSVTPL